MGKKFTIKDVQEFLDTNDVDHSCILLSTEYVNINVPLILRCNQCGQVFKRDFHHLKRGRFKCPSCLGHPNSGKMSPRKITIETIKDYINEYDINHECELLSTTYINTHEYLHFRCNICGKDFQRNANNLFKGRFRCEQCGELAGAKKLKYSKNDVQQKISERGYTIIGKYIKASEPVLCKCKRGHEFNLIFSRYLCGKSGCNQCVNIDYSGNKHPNWKGGISTLTDSLRTLTYPWRRDCLQASNYTCDITKVSNDLEVHHLINYSNIIQEAFQVLNLPIKKHLVDYIEKEQEDLKNYIISKHTLDLGIVLSKDIHNLYHKIYGVYNNTPEQYQQFKQNYLNGKYITQN